MSRSDRQDNGRTLDDERALEVLRAAGWFPGRSIVPQVEKWSSSLDQPGGFEIFEAARGALAEFGGLCVRMSGPGQEVARASFNLDPMLAQGEEERFADHGAQFMTRLYPLGEASDGNSFLAIDSIGRIYLLLDSCVLLAASTLEGLKFLILGRRASSQSQ